MSRIYYLMNYWDHERKNRFYQKCLTYVHVSASSLLFLASISSKYPRASVKIILFFPFKATRRFFEVGVKNEICIQDTLSSRRALGLAAA